MICGIFVATFPAFSEPMFQGFGEIIPGIGSVAKEVSADGGVVVGEGPDAFYWTSADGIVDIRDLGLIGGGPLTKVFSDAASVSGDGTTIVGIETEFNQVFLWTFGGGRVDLGVLSGHNVGNGAAVSSNGSVVVGSSGPNIAPGGAQAFSVDGWKYVRSGASAGRDQSE